MEEPKTTLMRPLADLAEPLDVTKAAIYAAAHKGYIKFVPVGSSMKISQETYEYHLKNGYGPSVPSIAA
ncbi:hypothetical protein D1823_02320 [Ruegeria sp. AD91A]|uniref:hypothetical protein n=1 Tax=Ruegeria sp. AD91A TaxID=2293862 RepID=UPI000E51E1E9|nr:hypothetical protein [Ruegeria sp. AD91A]AXT25533.1 hypothetical protein D1823_02320 [Ruegeria sp. AD91A]